MNEKKNSFSLFFFELIRENYIIREKKNKK
jgi:hypothetical protein